jgi:hypothetical protein
VTVRQDFHLDCVQVGKFTPVAVMKQGEAWGGRIDRSGTVPTSAFVWSEFDAQVSPRRIGIGDELRHAVHYVQRLTMDVSRQDTQ